MRTAGESALLQIRGELPKGILQFLRATELYLLRVEGGEAGGICHNGAGAEPKQLHMAGSMAATAQLVGDLPHLEAEAGLQGVEYAGFAHTGISCKGRNLSSNCPRELLQSLPCLGAHPEGGEPGSAVGLVELLRRIQVALVDADDRLAVPPLRNGNHAVNQEWVGNWNGAGGNDYELINVGHRRSLKFVPAGQDFIENPRPVIQRGEDDLVPHQGDDPLMAELSPSAAGDQNPISAVHVIEAAEGL